MRDFKNLSLGPEWIDQVQNIMQKIMTTVRERFDS